MAIRTRATLPAQKPSFSPAHLASLQRKCAYGTPTSGRKCEDGGKKPFRFGRYALQAKLQVSQPGDEFEQEADRVAESVLSGNAVVVGKAKPAPFIQRQGVDDQKPREQPTTFPAQETSKHGQEKEDDDKKKLGRGALKIASELADILWDSFSNSAEGKRILDANERDLKPILKFFEDFSGTLLGKLTLGAAAGGAVAGVAGGAFASRDDPSADPDTSPSTGGPVRRAPKDEQLFGLELKWDFVSLPTGVTLKTPWLDSPKIPLGSKSPAATPALSPAPVPFKMVSKFPRICTPADPHGDQGEADARSAFIFWWLQHNREMAEKRRQELLNQTQLHAPPKSAPSVLKPLFKRVAGAQAVHDPQAIEAGLHSPGQPLGPQIRNFMESRFGHDFSQVRVHSDAQARTSARAMNALAYTVGNDLVFGAGQYSPSTSHGRSLVAHELTHVLQQRGIAHPLLQRQPAPATSTTAPTPATPAAQAAPRQDYVFIMGEDRPGSRNLFYTEALRFYRAHVSQATFVTDQRTLADVLSYIRTNITKPLGNVYIVSHANEDGTLSFGLNSADQNAHVDVSELRTAIHPSGGSQSTLSDVSGQIDNQTRIHIKGCDIGRTQAMVELIDEAFGGAGTVTAPTHEQEFGFDPTLAAAESARVRQQGIAAFTATLPPVPPEPAPVDRALRGDAKRKAMQERAAAVAARAQVLRQRQQSIQQEERRIAPQVAQAGEVAGTYEAFSGPMFQRPGTSLYNAAELLPELKKLYAQLSERQQAALVARLVAPDPRSAAVAAQQRTFQQHGQRVYTVKPFTSPYAEPRSLAEANQTFHNEIREQHFTPKKLQAPATSGATVTYKLEGHFAPPGEDAYDNFLDVTVEVPDDASILSGGKDLVSNPDRYAWRVERTHASNGTTTAKAVGERVIAYLHHGSLDPAAHEHFTRPESDPNFFATSTFAPPPPAQPTAPAATP